MISSSQQAPQNKKNIYSVNESNGTRTTYDASLLTSHINNANESQVYGTQNQGLSKGNTL